MHARLRASLDDPLGTRTFESFLHDEITRPYVDDQPSSGTWGGNVLAWLNKTAPTVVLKYDDLVADAAKAVMNAVSSLMLPLSPITGAAPPKFPDLQARDATFFRRGIVGSHRDEMPPELHDLFWAQPENAAAMRLLGYART